MSGEKTNNINCNTIIRTCKRHLSQKTTKKKMLQLSSIVFSFIQYGLLAAVAILPLYLLGFFNLQHKTQLEKQIERERIEREALLAQELEQERLKEEESQNEQQREQARVILEKRMANEKHRQNTLQELLNTEETYLKHLGILVNDFMVPIKEKNLLQQKTYDTVFPVDINIIRNVNSMCHVYYYYYY
jgi:hypothetical protein